MRNVINLKIAYLLVIFLMFQSSADAKDKLLPGGNLNFFIFGAIAFVVASFSLTIYFLTLKNKFQKEAFRKSGKTKPASGLLTWWNELDKKYFTKAAPFEKEADVLLDHDYDGIKELDNALPPWWKWGFYITVIIGVIYLFRFHVTHSGPSPIDEYEKEMNLAAIQLDNYRMSKKESIDETNVTLADAQGIAEGKKIFSGTCIPCHGTNGEGISGPNLTDQYWLHGGSLGNVFKTITYGVPEKGMQPWGKVYSAGEIRNIASFVMSLQGTKPANGKIPEGNLYEPGKISDTSTIQKTDSLTIKSLNQ